MNAMGAPSPCLGPSFKIRVYPPGRSEKRGETSLKSRRTTVLLERMESALRRACKESRFPNVTSFSTNGRNSLAFATVVRMRSCVISEAAMLRSKLSRCSVVRPSLR